MNIKSVMKRASAFILALGVLLVMTASIPGEPVSAGTFTYTKNFNQFASSYTGTISMPTKSFSISEKASWITAAKISYNTFKISITQNHGAPRNAAVTIYNGGSTYIYNIYQAAGAYIVHLEMPSGQLISYQTVYYNQYISLPILPSDKNELYEYRFLGWDENPTAQVPSFTRGVSYKNLNGQSKPGVTLYPIWLYIQAKDGTSTLFRTGF